MASFGIGNALYAGEQGQFAYQHLLDEKQAQLMRTLQIQQKLREQASADAYARMLGAPAAPPGAPAPLAPYKPLPQTPMPGQPSVPMVQLPKRPPRPTPAAPMQQTVPNAPGAPPSGLPYPGAATTLEQRLKEYEDVLARGGVMPGTVTFANAMKKKQAELVAEDQAQQRGVQEQLGLSEHFTPESLKKFRQTHDWNDLVPIPHGAGLGGAGQETLDPTTIAMMGDMVIAGQPMNRVLGSMGRGSTKARAQVMRYVAAKLKANHAPITQVLLAEGTLQANKASLQKITQYSNMIKVILSKNTLDMGLLQQVLASGVGGAFPLANKGIQALRRQFGSAKIVEFENAIQTVKNDYARIMSGPLSQGRIQQGAMDEANKILNSSMNTQQILGALKIMRAEMEHEYAGTDQTINAIGLQIGTPPVLDTGVPKGWKIEEQP